MRLKNTPLILLPFALIWGLIEFIFKMTGRLVAAVVGLVLMIAGLVLCVTVVGVVIGGPLAAFGLLLMIRGFF